MVHDDGTSALMWVFPPGVSDLFQMDFRSILIWFLLGLLESMYWSDVQPASEDLHGHQYMKLTIITAELASHHFPASGLCGKLWM